MEIVLFNDVRNKKELKKQLMCSAPIRDKMCSLFELLHRELPSTAEAYYDKVILKYLPRHDFSLLKIVRDTGNEHLIQDIEKANYYIQADLNGVEKVIENIPVADAVEFYKANVNTHKRGLMHFISDLQHLENKSDEHQPFKT